MLKQAIMRVVFALLLLTPIAGWAQLQGMEPATPAGTGLPMIDPKSGKPKLGAYVVSVNIAEEDADKNGPLRITYSDGTSVTISRGGKGREPDDNQAGFSSAKIADDKKTVGWIETIDWCCASYPLPHVLDVFRDGRFLLHVEVQSMIYTYRFSANSAQVGVLWGFPHGSTPAFYELYDLNSSKKIAEASADPDDHPDVGYPQLDKNAPDWAKQLERDWFAR